MSKKKSLFYTPESKLGLKESLSILKGKVSEDKIKSIRKSILDRAEILRDNSEIGQLEPLLSHLEQSHRRIIESHYKIIYLVQEERVIVTDIFDSRQNPKKMRG